MATSVSDIFPTSTYNVNDDCKIKIGTEEYEAKLSYTLYLEPDKQKTNTIQINRTNLKVNGQKIDTKFLEIANNYMEALFPICCTINNYKLVVENITDIRKRIQNADIVVHEIYHGEGIEHIQKQFFAAVQTDEKLVEFILQLHFMKILEYSLQKFNPGNQFETSWKVLPIGNTEWKGKINYQKEKNTLLIEPKIDSAQDIMNDIIRYIHKHEYYVGFDEETLPLYADFRSNINYTGETGRIREAETYVCIEAEEKFYYQHTITIQTK